MAFLEEERAEGWAAHVGREKSVDRFARVADGWFTADERAVTAGGLELKPEFEARRLMMKALCHLRIGEQANCLTNHNGDSCVFPIRGGGCILRPEGSRAGA